MSDEPLFCRWLFMDVHLGCDNPRVDVNLSIHCETDTNYLLHYPNL